MSQSEETPISDSTPTDSALHLGLHSLDPDPSPNPDPSPSDLNHSAQETDHDQSNLEQQLQNLDLKEEEGEEEEGDEEAEKKDDRERESDNEADVDAAGDDEDEVEEKNEYEDDDENVTNEGRRSHYPVRPEAEDCAYYMKTGLCKFGSNCKFNHPVRRKNQAVKEKVKEKDESTEKPSQTECKYYLRTGGCKFGKACRYNHSRAKTAVAPILELNFLGLPIRPGEKECPYYMRNGSCKYGANCRFNHPDPTTAGACDPPSGYGNGGPVSSQAASQVNIASWSSPRTLNETPYMPMMFSPTQGVPPPNPEWNGYQTTVYAPERNLHPTPAYVMNNPSTETAVYTHHQPQMLVDEFPVRPGQPECSYFMKTGDCKFKSNCKYHHPKNRVAKPSPCTLSDKGLPLRPTSVFEIQDQSICSHYSRYGICKFGPACKFDHSVQAAPSVVSGLDQPLPFSNSAATEESGIAGSNGTDTAVQQSV
ncbi:hypothetical protein QUC31_007688 [Theobroma cacao]|uniref:Zinc finger CCCH domain-containing protein 43 isoform X1 n=1 Tax=Theobroma cacao TaxID=3641 RepID=A0AB32W2K2_THECC|nr:PREDICTED: zinc finger CCCH domain-containing protein 43 isoform X1 [Theobroma cacao]